MPAININSVYNPNTCVSVTVPDDGNPHQLLSLIKGVDPNAPPRCWTMIIQNDPDHSTQSAIFGGNATDDQGQANGSALTSTNYAMKIVLGGTITLGGGGPMQDLINVAREWVMPAVHGGGALQLNVRLIRG